MKKMSLNYKDGMFLGKQELERQNLISQALTFGIQRLFVQRYIGIENWGLLNPKKLNIRASIISGSGIAFYADERSTGTGENCLGRLVVGKNINEDLIGLPICNSNDISKLTLKEAFIPTSSYPSGNATRYVYLVPTTTNYENCLITIDANKNGQLSASDMEGIADLFRNAANGRNTKIKTSGNQVLTIQSINTTTGAITFVENTTAETNAQFMFVHTMSPLVSGNVEPIYSYPSCSIYLDANNNQSNYGSRLMIAKITFASGVPTNVSIEDTTSADEPHWIDTLAPEQVGTEHLKDECVTHAKMADNAIQANNIVDGAITTVKIVDSAITNAKIAQNAVKTDNVYPQSITRPKLDYKAFGFNDCDIVTITPISSLNIQPGKIFIGCTNALAGSIKITTPDRWSSAECTCQPAKLILFPYTGSEETKYIKPIFNTGLSVPNLLFSPRFNTAINVWTTTNYYIIDIYWMGLNTVLIALDSQ